MKSQMKTALGRRQFFRVLGAGATAGLVAPLATKAMADNESVEEKKKAQYRESQEVKTFYRVNRYPGR